MKKFIIISVLIVTCNKIDIAQSQKKVAKTSAQKLEEAWAQLKKSKDTTAMLITDIKKLATEKVVYRTKLVQHIDTVWRIDTCITVFTPIDSATIAIMFKNRDIPKKTTIGRVIQYIFNKKKKQ